MSLAVASSAAAAAPPHIIRAWQKFVNFKLLTRKQQSSLDQCECVAALDSGLCGEMSSTSRAKSEGAAAGQCKAQELWAMSHVPGQAVQ